MPQMKEKIKIPKGYTKRERTAIAQEIIDFIRYRTRELGKDKNDKKFIGYSKAYKESLDFKIAGKSSVDLTLSGELIDSVKKVGDSDGEIWVGHDGRSKKINGKAEGNIKGTYGNEKRKNKTPRDYLGISKKELGKILKLYPLHDPVAREISLKLAEKAAQEAEQLVEGVAFAIDE